MSDAAEWISYELDDGVAIVRLDDGKVNSLPPEAVVRLDELLTRAEDEARALVLVGREGTVPAGFDLQVMQSGVEPMRDLVASGARLLCRLYGSPLPVVVACTGHALAMGALVLLSADTRIGPDADAKIGLNEVAIGMGLPIMALELARDRLSKRHLTVATVQAQLYSPSEAIDAGFIDRVVPVDQVATEAVAEAQRLSEHRRGAILHTKDRLRGPVIERILSTLDADMTSTGMPD